MHHACVLVIFERESERDPALFVHPKKFRAGRGADGERNMRARLIDHLFSEQRARRRYTLHAQYYVACFQTGEVCRRVDIDGINNDLTRSGTLERVKRIGITHCEANAAAATPVDDARLRVGFPCIDAKDYLTAR
eukprot:scaffold10560_cov133-Isochrysis_galbana.AAC.16